MLEFHLRRWGSVLTRLTLIGIGIVLIGGGFWVLLTQRETYEQVVVTTRMIPYGTQIQADDLTVLSIPASQPPALRGLSSPDAVVGKYGLSDIPASVMIQPHMIADSPPNDLILPNGYRIRPGMVVIQRNIGAYAAILRESVNRRVTIPFDIFWGSVSPTYCRPTNGSIPDDVARQLPGEVTYPDIYEVGVCYAGMPHTMDLVYIADEGTIGFFEVPVSFAQSLLALEQNPAALSLTMIARAPGTEAPVIIRNPLYPSDVVNIGFGERRDSDQPFDGPSSSDSPSPTERESGMIAP